MDELFNQGIEPADLEGTTDFGIIGGLIQAVSNRAESTSAAVTNLTPFVTYCYSWYGIACMAMAILLNRTLIIASTNTSRFQQQMINRQRNLFRGPDATEFLKSATFLIFRLGAISVLLYNAYNILVTLKFNGKLIGAEDRLIYRILDGLKIFDYNIETANPYLKTPKLLVMIGPSTDIYWPTFLGFCLLAYMETFVSAINGDKPYIETGLTLFEHSLAFQEASSKGTFFLGNRNVVRKPTEELMIICLFLTLNHLNIQIGGLLNNNKYRLIPSTIIGASFLTYYTNLLRNGGWTQFPIIITGSILPQLLIVAIIFASMVIFIMAILSTGFNLQDLNYASFFTTNDDEFQERVLFKLSDDFYTTLINLGMLSITLAGKSSYITELSLVTIDEETWLERNIWDKFKRHLKNGKLNMGYGNLIDNPPMDLISNISRVTKLNENDTVIKRRINSIVIMITNLYQLGKGLFMDKFLYKYILKNHIIKEKEFEKGTVEELEQRRQKVPKFLQTYVQPSDKPKPKSDKIIELDDMDDIQISENYLNLIAGEFSERDNSEDFQVEEEDSDLESIIDETDIEDISFSPQEFIELVNEEMNVEILNSHLNNEGTIMTRSRFNKILPFKDESSKLLEVLLSKRKNNISKVLNGETDDEDYDSKLSCVVCQVNNREIITWPCKCFSICESCRLTLASKAIEGCVCCRRPVEGVSKVFIP